MKLSVIISSLLLYSRPTLALAVSKSTTRSPQVTPLAKREDVPTLTIDPITKYFPSGASSPQPSGTSLQIFPTGIYDNVPEDGLTVALGPELRKQINDAASSKCNSQSFAQECEDVLVSIIQQTDLQPHTKRFGPAVIGLLALGALIGVIMQEQRIHSIGAEIPETLHLSPGDVAKVVSMSDAATFAVTQIGATTTPYTVTWKPAPTSTSPNFITIETLPVDKDDHKAGDIVYRIPKDAAQRISDFLAITGIQDTQNICKGHNMRRADPVQECLQRIQRHAMDLVDTGPANLLQIAQQNIPARPPAGQAIGFPIEMIANEGIPLLIPVYRVVVAHAPPRPDLDMGWDPVVLAKSATAITIAAHAAIFVGQSILEMWIPKDKLTPDLREDRLSCPKDMLCVDDECQGQKEDTNIVGVRPYCKKVTNFGCKCRAVTYPHLHVLDSDYMDAQYDYLEWLIKRATLPSLAVICSEGDQEIGNAANKFLDQVEKVCKDHANLNSSFQTAETLEPGFTFALNFEKSGRDCSFDCVSLFSTFAEEGLECVAGGKMKKFGEVKTECGKFWYTGYNLS